MERLRSFVPLALVLGLTATVPAAGLGLDLRAVALAHLPLVKFAAGEPYFTASFYFDMDVDVHDNPADYGPGARLQAYAHVNPDVQPPAPLAGAARFLVVQYWYYYVANVGGPWPLAVYPDHPQDWDSVVQVWWAWGEEEPLLARASAHGSFGPPVPWPALEREGSHPVLYVARGDHAGGLNGLAHGELPAAAAGVGRAARPEEFDVALVGEATDSIVVGGARFDAVGWEGAHPSWDAFARSWWPTDFGPGGGTAPWRRAVWREPWRELTVECPPPAAGCPPLPFAGPGVRPEWAKAYEPARSLSGHGVP